MWREQYGEYAYWFLTIKSQNRRGKENLKEVLLENNQEYPREMNSRVLHPFKNSYQLLYNFAQIILCFINKSTSWQFTLVIPYNFLCGDITYKLLLKVRKF